MTRPSVLAVLALGVVLVAPVWAQRQGDPEPPKAPATPEAPKAPVSRAPINVVLNKPVAQIEWDEMPLESVVDWVQDQGAVNVVVRWRSLEAEGIERDAPVSLRLRNTTVRQVLTEALDQLAEGGAVRFRALGNTIQISTRTDFNRKMYTRVYDLADILARVPNFTDVPEITVDSQEGGGASGGQSGITTSTGSLFGESDEEEEEEDSDELDRERMQELIDVIIATIEPETWQDRGGEGTIVGFNKTIVIRNTIEVHEQIGGPYEVR